MLFEHSPSLLISNPLEHLRAIEMKYLAAPYATVESWLKFHEHLY